MWVKGFVHRHEGYGPYVEHGTTIAQALSEVDAASCDTISKKELSQVLHTLDPQMNADVVESLLVGAGLAGGVRVSCSKFVSWLLQGLPADLPAVDCRPLKQLADEQRRQFIEEEWLPFVGLVRRHLDCASERRARGFTAHEILPSHANLSLLAERCLELTRRWHGRANVSMLYELFMEMAELDGHSPYFFCDIPQKRSADGYTRVLDGQARRRLYSAKPAGAACAKNSTLVGTMHQNTGESPIDNLHLPNILPRRDALLLTAGHRIQQFLLLSIRWKQRRILAKLFSSGSNFEESAVKQKVQEIVDIESVQGSLAHDLLVAHGCLLRSYGQIPEDSRQQAEEFIAGELGKSSFPEPEEELQTFLKHCSDHPGRAFRNPVQHKLMLLKAFKSPAVRVLWRSDIERFSQHKYFSVPWTRSVPLVFLPVKEGGETDIDLAVARPAGVKECTRFRKNVFAYGESHGLGQSGGGWAESRDWPVGTLMYELGALLCEDEAAKVANHWVTDIEKIIRDCLILCPEGGMASALPGEVLHDAGQNPVIASSIGATQHTQATRASASDFPLMAEHCDPKWFESIGGWLDIVQVGQEEDAFFVSARSRAPDAPSFLQFLVDLRTRYLRVFGRTVDFNVTCHPTVEGEFIINFAPVACMQKISVPKGEGCMGLDFDFQNPELGERVTQHRLPVASVDCSHGKGNILAASDEYWNMALDGRPMLARLYDFNRKLGARAVARAAMDELRS